MYPRNAQIFSNRIVSNITTLFCRSQFYVPLYVRNREWGSRYRGLGILTLTPDFNFWNDKNSGYGSKKCSDIFESNCFLTRLHYFIGHSYMFQCMSKIEGRGQNTVAWVSWPPPQTFVFKIIRNSVMYPRNAQIFSNQIVSNITTLFYRSQLHVQLYVRNRGCGSRYHGLGILTPTPDFYFWNYKNFSYVSKKCSDIFESNCFLTRLLYVIGHSYMFHCMSGIEGVGQDTVAWVSWPPPQTFIFEIIRISVMCPRNAQIFSNQIVS